MRIGPYADPLAHAQWSAPKLPKKGGEYNTMCTGPHAFIAADKTVQVRLQFHTTAGFAENVLNFQASNGWSEASARQLGAFLVDWWENDVAPIVSQGVDLWSIVLTDLTSENGFQVVYNTGLPVYGTNQSGALPDNVTAAIKLSTDNRGRSYRGRIFHVGMAGDLIDGSALTITFQQLAVSAYSSLKFISLQDTDAYLSIVSLCHNGVWREGAEVTHVTAVTTDTSVDSMRRRLIGRGM
jgi:hypothetical protein